MFRTKTPFETEAKGNWEMAYYLALTTKIKNGRRKTQNTRDKGRQEPIGNGLLR